MMSGKEKTGKRTGDKVVVQRGTTSFSKNSYNVAPNARLRKLAAVTAITLLLRHRRRWKDNIKMDLGEPEWGGMDWIGLAYDRDQ
jgi:hypothetical protein